MTASTIHSNRPTSRASAALVQAPAPGKTAQQRGRGSRTKGQSGEREVAAILEKLTGHDVRRRVRQHAGDSDLDGLVGWSVEIKRHATTPPAKLASWWAQTVDQARVRGELPVLFFRGDRAEWRVVWPAALHAGARKSISADYSDCLTGTPAVWWAMCRHMTSSLHQ